MTLTDGDFSAFLLFFLVAAVICDDDSSALLFCGVEGSLLCHSRAGRMADLFGFFFSEISPKF